jgi:hypothetical protein
MPSWRIDEFRTGCARRIGGIGIHYKQGENVPTAYRADIESNTVSLRASARCSRK